MTKTQLGLKAWYTVAELAELAGTSSRRVARVLESNGVELRPCGGGTERQRRVVMLSDIKAGFPAFWDSLLDMISASQGARAQVDDQF